MRAFLVLAVVALFVVGIIGCEEEVDRRDEDRRSERIERDLERDLDRELDKAEEELDRVRERLEDKLEEEDLRKEEIDRIQREIEESVLTGIARVGQVLEKIGNKIQEDSDVEVVDFREFREMLPDEIMGMDRVDWDGANKDALGMRFSILEANYEGSESHMEIAILDLGTMKGLAAMGFNFMDRQIDEENRDGFKRTRSFQGYSGFESVEYHNGHVEMQGVVIIAKRFVIAADVEGENLEKDFLEDLFEELPLRRLERLGN